MCLAMPTPGSIFMPPRSRAGADASAHVGHAPRLLGWRGGAGVSDNGKEGYSVPPLIEKLAHNIIKRKHAKAVIRALSSIKKST